MGVDIIYEPHATTTDDEAGRATGWLPGKLSMDGLRYARALGERRRGEGLSAVFCSDLYRAVATVQQAFGGYRIPIHRDTRLRECDFGDLNGAPAAEVAARQADHLDQPFPNGQSYRQVVDQMRGFLHDLVAAWDGHRVLLVAHQGNRWALEHLLDGRPLADLVTAPPDWRASGRYALPKGWAGGQTAGGRLD
ncbi:histidine phosphatase family protein [Micromonospora sp. NPDC050397]|uniref:histidine phosphatase family protein n=1 Tax=Micromonospora sp. NPDC050397 TaxID=3364279 RepID=UPI00384C5AB0